MLKIFIGPNGCGKTYSLDEEIKKLIKEEENRKDIIKLNSEIVYADEMKDTVSNSFLMEYIITELLMTDEISEAQKKYESLVDDNIKKNKSFYNDSMKEVLALNNQKITKDVITNTPTKEYKKVVKINPDDLKNSMGSGQKLQFLLKLIEKSNKKYVFLDEPENHTHPSLLHKTAQLINNLSKEKTIYVATHSPELLSMLEIDFNNLYIYNDTEFKGPKQIDFEKAIKSLPTGVHIENLNNKSKTYYNKDSLVKNILQLHKKEFMSALFSKKVYIVEGINDELFLKKLLSHFNKQYEQYNIFQCYGKPHYFPFISIFQDLNIEITILYDKDKDKDKQNDVNGRINNALNLIEKSHGFDGDIEHELVYLGDKRSTPEFIEFLDNYKKYEEYESLL